MKNKESAFIEEYLKGGTLTDITKRAGITRKTAYRYLEDETIKKEIEQEQRNKLLDINRVLLNSLELAVQEIVKIIGNENTNPNIKLNACNSLFNHYKTISENVEFKQDLAMLLDKVDFLEQKANENTK